MTLAATCVPADYGLKLVANPEREYLSVQSETLVLTGGHVDAIRPFVSVQVWSLVRLQLLTAARCGELVNLRPIDLDTAGKVWVCRLEQHKTAHRGHLRSLSFGPKAQRILAPLLLDRAVNDFIFKPSEAEAKRLQRQHEARQIPAGYGNGPGSNRQDDPQRQPGEHYKTASYRRAITRACDQAWPPPEHLKRQRTPGNKAANSTRWETELEWESRLGVTDWSELQTWRREHRWSPHQLRHTAATRIRQEFGLEMARQVLGHAVGGLAVTQIYAEQDEAAAAAAMLKIG